MSTLVTKKIIPQDLEDHFNVITINGKIEPENQSAFFDNFHRAPDFPFLVYVCSLGGSDSTGLGIMDAIGSINRPVTIVSRGRCCSMGAILPHIDNAIRLCYMTTTFMYHEAFYTVNGVREIIDQKLEIGVVNDNYIADRVMRNVGLTKAQYKKYSRRDYYLGAEEAINVGKYGMIDGIIIKDYRDGRFLIKTREGNKEINITQHRRADIKNLPVTKG